MQIKLSCSSVFAIVVLIFSSYSSWSQKLRNEEVYFSPANAPRARLAYLLYKPNNFRKDKLFPLLVFLHGSGAGDNLEKLKETGIPKLIEEGKDFPFIIISPQLKDDNHWPPELVKEFIAHVSKDFQIDLNRIYLTGFSMGGTGVWDYAMAYPSSISCAVPISGWGNTKEVCKLKVLPTWVFHGADDKIVNPIGSRKLTSTLKNCGGNVILTELSNVGHEAWRETYSYPGLMDWILSKNKADTTRRKGHVEIDDKTVAYKLPKALNLITGIDCSEKGELYGIVGKSSQPMIFNFDTLGHIKKMIKLTNASNLSWQDITHGDNGFLYIADVGNDGFKRKFFQIYKVKESDFINKDLLQASKIEFTLPDNKSFNFKSIFYLNNRLYLFGVTSLHEIYLVEVEDQTDSTALATILVNCKNLKMGSITSACFDTRSKSIFLLDKRKIGVVKLLKGIESLNEGLTYSIILPSESAKEGISISPNGDIAFVDQNFLGTTDGNLYLMHLK